MTGQSTTAADRPDHRAELYAATCTLPEDTFGLGEKIGESLVGGEVVLLYGGLGAGKTLLAKGILNSLDYDFDEVTSPSFTLVNLYKTPKFDVYHIDLWRLDGLPDAAAAVGLDEMLEKDGVVIIEWAENLGNFEFSRPIMSVELTGDGDEPRQVSISRQETGRTDR